MNTNAIKYFNLVQKQAVSGYASNTNQNCNYFFKQDQKWTISHINTLRASILFRQIACLEKEILPIIVSI